MKRNEAFVTNSNLLIPSGLQPADGVIKLLMCKICYLTELGLRH